MAEPDGVFDVFLGPGDFWFGDRDTRIRTVLGSCVAITFWHPRALIGGMCHYMNPYRGIPRSEGAPLDGRYADEAVQMFLNEIERAGTKRHDYVVKMFGGGRQFAATDPYANGTDIPSRNIETGMDLLAREGITITAMHLGGNGHRQVLLDLWSGDVWLRHDTATGAMAS